VPHGGAEAVALDREVRTLEGDFRVTEQSRFLDCYLVGGLTRLAGEDEGWEIEALPVLVGIYLRQQGGRPALGVE